MMTAELTGTLEAGTVKIEGLLDQRKHGGGQWKRHKKKAGWRSQNNMYKAAGDREGR